MAYTMTINELIGKEIMYISLNSWMFPLTNSKHMKYIVYFSNVYI